MRHITMIFAALALAVAAPAVAGKGGNGNGGGNPGLGDNASPKTYSPSLSVTWPLRLTSDAESVPYAIEGCGYDATYGVVIVVVNTPVAVAWTARDPDSNGCISVSNFSTQGAGHYSIEARQTVKNRSVVVASTGFDA